MFARKLRALLVIALSMLSVSIARAENAAERCAEAIAKIRSYDVAYSVEDVMYLDAVQAAKAHLPTRVHSNTLNKRDVMAFGLGRRFEDFVGTNRQVITIFDWTSASAGKLVPCRKGFCSDYEHRGRSWQWLSGLFQSQLLGVFPGGPGGDKNSVIHMLDASSSPKGLIGFEVKNPQVPAAVRAWADPDRGYMPSIIEHDTVTKQGRIILRDRIRVTEFTQAGDGVWVPIKGTYDDLVAVSLAPGTAYPGTSLVVNVKQSSWNSIDSGTLFAEASMPAPNNNVQQEGFKRHFPPNTLAEIKKAERAYNDGAMQFLSQGKSSRFGLFFAINVLALILLAVIFVWRRNRRRHRAATR